MNQLSSSILLFISFASIFIPIDSKACTLEIQKQSDFKILFTGHCQFSIINNKKYFDISHYKATNQAFDNIVREGIDIAEANGHLYLPMEFIDDANYSVTPISISPLRRFLPGSRFLESRSLINATSVPKRQFKNAILFSMKLSCIEIAGGDDMNSFTTRYCTPLTKNSDRELIAYQKFIEAIEIKGTR